MQCCYKWRKGRRRRACRKQEWVENASAMKASLQQGSQDPSRMLQAVACLCDLSHLLTCTVSHPRLSAFKGQ